MKHLRLNVDAHANDPRTVGDDCSQNVAQPPQLQASFLSMGYVALLCSVLPEQSLREIVD